VLTSIIVAGEALYGLRKGGSAKMSRQLEVVLGSLEVTAFEHPAEVHYADIRNRLRAEGTPIGANDMLIAAHALALSCVLVTANEREFCRVEGLEVENWLT